MMSRKNIYSAMLLAAVGAFHAGCVMDIGSEDGWDSESPEVGEITLDTTIGPCADRCRANYDFCSRDCPGCRICVRQRTNCYNGCDSADSDGDGVLDGNDNCPATYNPDQADCDGDFSGNACDSLNAIYVSGPEQTCWIDMDDHVIDYTLEHKVEWLSQDVSACGAPAFWSRRIRLARDCNTFESPGDCCRSKLSESILATGASPELWCGGFRDQNHCH
jgi:hypothetical protein